MESPSEEPDEARLAKADRAARDLARRPETGRHTEMAGAAQALESELEDLRWNWDGAYEISWHDGLFRAVRLDGRGDVAAATAQDLRDLILADYTGCPVPRQQPEDPADEE